LEVKGQGHNRPPLRWQSIYVDAEASKFIF